MSSLYQVSQVNFSGGSDEKGTVFLLTSVERELARRSRRARGGRGPVVVASSCGGLTGSGSSSLGGRCEESCGGTGRTE